VRVGSPTTSPIRVAFLFLGRKGSFGQFALELARAAVDCEGLDPTLIIARSSQTAARFDELGERLLKLDTYDDRPIPELLVNYPAARKALLAYLASRQPAAVITLMPHVWTPLLAPAIRRLGISYISIAHDAGPHPGPPRRHPSCVGRAGHAPVPSGLAL
jgi:hypothetical protein